MSEENFEGLPEQLLKYIEELKEEIVAAYEYIIIALGNGRFVKHKNQFWYEIIGPTETVVRRLIEMGEWERSKSTKNQDLYRPIKKKKKKEKYYWKVVAKNGDRLVSSIAHIGKFSVDYKLGGISYPHPDLPNSKLLVFNTRREARRFKKIISHTVSPYSEIYKVEVTKPVTINKLCYLSIFNAHYYSSSDKIKYLWSNDSQSNKLFIDQLNETPDGTIGVDSVKLIERVW